MAHMLFEEIIYDLDGRRIVDFRLKPRAERYLVVRTNLYGNDGASSKAVAEAEQNAHLKETTDLCPIGIRGTKRSTPRAGGACGCPRSGAAARRSMP
jgi:hypothetical protein